MPPAHDIPQAPPTYVPQAAVLIPLLIAALAVVLWRISRGRRGNWPRLALGAIVCIYAVVVVKGTFLPCPLGTTGTFGDPWRDYINLTPLQNTDFWDDMVENALLFIPVGVLLPLLTRVRAIWLTTLIGSLISLGIETGQFITDVTLHAGHVADINDWMFNTLGVLIGFLLLRLVMQIPLAVRLVDAIAWPQPTPPPPRSPVRPSARKTEPVISRDRREYT
jgi:glycopeptide antibiotics resistance protein